MQDEKLLKTEQLLREAAEWEPVQAPPPSLTQAALTAALEQQRRIGGGGGQSRTTMFLAIALGGGMAASSLAAALWAVALPKSTQGRPQPLMRAELAGIRKDPVPVRQVAQPPRMEMADAPAPSSPGAQLVADAPRPRRTFRRKLRTIASRTPKAERRLPSAVWDTQEVEKRHAGLLGPAVLIQPGPVPNTVYVEPGVVSIPLENPNIACAPVGPPPDEQEMPAPTPPENSEGAPQKELEKESPGDKE